MIPYSRFARCVAAGLALLAGVSLTHAQDTNAPSDTTAAPSPSAQSASSTNTPSGNLTGSSTEGGQPSTNQPTLSLLPSPGADVEPSMPSTPDPITANNGMVPGTTPLDPDVEAEDLANHLLVVYNRDDFESKDLAEYYALRRNIPPERVLALSCSKQEEITRAEFEKTIRQPILFYLLQKGWMLRASSETRMGERTIRLLVATHNDIWAIVLMRGVPLKVAPDASDDDIMEHDPALATNAAAVDSELALLPMFGFPKGGFVPNVFYDAQMLRQHRVGAALAKNLILVTRLDGPTAPQVRRMIDDTLYAEKNRLAGLAVVDTRNITDEKNGYIKGDVWLRDARKMLLQDGWMVKYDDKPEVLPATDPCNQVALYLGWYSAQAEGPWVTSPDRFVRGAIAYHLHSYSANTVRSETDNWVGPLIAHGAAATMGTVYEPYMALTPHEDIFTKRLLAGDYFAEAAYASIPGLSWMDTVVGDPLYRPFRVPLETAVAAVGTPRTDHDDWLLLQQIQREVVAGQIEARSDRFPQSIEVPGAGPVAEESLGDILENLKDPQAGKTIERAYQKAFVAYPLPIDQIRVGLKLAQYYSSHGQETLAESRVAMLRQLYPADAIRFGLGGSIAPTAASQMPPPPQPQPSQMRTVNQAGVPMPPRAPLPPFPHPETTVP